MMQTDAMNTTVHFATQSVPYELAYGRKPPPFSLVEIVARRDAQISSPVNLLPLRVGEQAQFTFGDILPVPTSAAKQRLVRICCEDALTAALVALNPLVKIVSHEVRLCDLLQDSNYRQSALQQQRSTFAMSSFDSEQLGQLLRSNQMNAFLLTTGSSNCKLLNPPFDPQSHSALFRQIAHVWETITPDPCPIGAKVHMPNSAVVEV